MRRVLSELGVPLAMLALAVTIGWLLLIGTKRLIDWALRYISGPDLVLVIVCVLLAMFGVAVFIHAWDLRKAPKG